MMAAGPLPPMDFLRHLRAAVAGCPPTVSDAELLDRFARSRDEAAFELLVWRHGRLVWGVCRRVARDRHAAEDAFQAVFLALARHAGSVSNRSAVAGWLYRVAYRAGLEAGRRFRSRAEPLTDAEAMSDRSPSPPEEAARRDLRRVIDAEVNRLSEPFRAAFVLCELQGFSNAEAAVALGCPVGTVESRLTRARAKLARRLSARGVTTAGGFAGLSVVSVPGDVQAAAVRAGVEGSAGVSVGVAALAARACGASAWPRVATGLIVAVTAATAIGLSAAQNPETGSPDQPTAKKTTTDPPAVDPLPDGAIARLGSTRFRTPFAAWYPVVSPDGKSLAVSGSTRVTVFDVSTGRSRFTVPIERTNSLASLPVQQFASNEELVVLHAIDNSPELTARRVDPTGRTTQQVRLASPRTLKAWNWSLSRDGTRAAVVWTGAKSVLQVLDTQTAKVLVTQPIGDTGHTVRIGPALSADGRLAALVNTGYEVQVFAVDTGAEVDRWKLPATIADGLAFSPDGNHLVVSYGGSDWTTCVRDLRSKKTIRRIEKAPASYFAFHPTDDVLAYGAGGLVTVWDQRKGHARHRLGRGIHTRAATFSPDGKVLITCEYSGAICLWDMETGKQLPVSADPPGQAKALRLLADGRVLAELTSRWIMWDAPDRPPVPLKRLDSYYEGGCDLSPDGTRAAFCGPDGITVLDIRTGDRIWSEKPPRGDTPYTVRYDRGGRLVVRYSAALEVRDAATGRLEKTVPAPNGGKLLGLTADGKRVFTDQLLGMIGNHVVKALDLESGKHLWTEAENGIESNQEVATSPDGRLVAWYSPHREPKGAVHVLKAGRVVVRETATGRPVWQVEEDKLYVKDLCFSPDGQLLATAEQTGQVRLWDAASGKPVWEFKHGSVVTAVAFSPDGMTLAAASADAPVYLWDVFGTRTRKGPPPDRGTLRKAVADLATADPAVVFRAARTLHAAPGEAVATIRDGVKPIAVPDPAGVRRLIAELDSPDFRTRDAAERTLTGHAPLVKDVVKAALGAGPSAEQRERLARVLAAADRPTAGDHQRRRAATILKRIGSPEAREVLKAIGSPGGQ